MTTDTSNSDQSQPKSTRVEAVDFDIFGEADEASASANEGGVPTGGDVDFDIVGDDKTGEAPAVDFPLDDSDMDADDATRFSATTALPPRTEQPVVVQTAATSAPVSESSGLPKLIIGAVIVAVLLVAAWWFMR